MGAVLTQFVDIIAAEEAIDGALILAGGPTMLFEKGTGLIRVEHSNLKQAAQELLHVLREEDDRIRSTAARPHASGHHGDRLPDEEARRAASSSLHGGNTADYWHDFEAL